MIYPGPLTGQSTCTVICLRVASPWTIRAFASTLAATTGMDFCGTEVRVMPVPTMSARRCDARIASPWMPPLQASTSVSDDHHPGLVFALPLLRLRYSCRCTAPTHDRHSMHRPQTNFGLRFQADARAGKFDIASNLTCSDMAEFAKPSSTLAN